MGAIATLIGGTRARDAAVYPPGLCKAIARGAAEQLRRDERALHAPGLHAVRGPAVSAEVHCGAAPGREKNEDDELAAWPAHDVHDEITGPCCRRTSFARPAPRRSSSC